MAAVGHIWEKITIVIFAIIEVFVCVGIEIINLITENVILCYINEMEKSIELIIHSTQYSYCVFNTAQYRKIHFKEQFLASHLVR